MNRPSPQSPPAGGSGSALTRLARPEILALPPVDIAITLAFLPGSGEGRALAAVASTEAGARCNRLDNTLVIRSSKAD